MECDNNVSAHQPGATATPKVVEQNDTPMATDVIKEETKEEDCIIQLTQSDHGKQSIVLLFVDCLCTHVYVCVCMCRYEHWSNSKC